ncbi:flavin reductase domain protein FMN-binding protein [Acetobacter senegalensis]|uniref:Flavin reductase domain protein FMN-binding protein n=1 Tax=Acetobacter senegalensis TaxID=446692 RepID=A0A0U5ETA1_9PROT|nr:flavin reductase family protein [Acetobacter senegalensis]CEF40703.1 flavin reductase domain protein FMN-binding protein [Acetobacter senegalensis]
MTSLTSDQFRRAMSHFATGVAVVTARGEEGEQGATISALSSVSLDPLMLLICLNRRSSTCRAIEHSGRFGVSILRQSQEAVAMHFAGPAKDKQFDDYCVRQEDGLFFVCDALVQIGVEVVETLRGGTHEIFLARPVHVAMNSDSEVGPLLYYRGAFDLAS